MLDPSDLRPAGVMFRRSLEPRVHFFFTLNRWQGTPSITEPHKCTEPVWANPDQVPSDALDYVVPALENARSGRAFHEYGWGSEPATTRSFSAQSSAPPYR